MAQRKYVFKFTPAWRKQQSEQWLENMAAQGWHLISGPIFFCFEKGEPEAVRYRFDYRPRPNLKEYFDLCKDAGWEHVFSFLGWRLFRTSQEDAPELYTDEASRRGIFRRLSITLGIIFLADALLLAWSMRDKTLAQFFQNSDRLTGFLLGAFVGLLVIFVPLIWSTWKQQKLHRGNAK